MFFGGYLEYRRRVRDVVERSWEGFEDGDGLSSDSDSDSSKSDDDKDVISIETKN